MSKWISSIFLFRRCVYYSTVNLTHTACMNLQNNIHLLSWPVRVLWASAAAASSLLLLSLQAKWSQMSHVLCFKWQGTENLFLNMYLNQHPKSFRIEFHFFGVVHVSVLFFNTTNVYSNNVLSVHCCIFCPLNKDFWHLVWVCLMLLTVNILNSKMTIKTTT